MPMISYKTRNFREDALETIERANEIINEYQGQGYDLTLRQLYYQFVARDYIPNKESEYKRLGALIADARLAGLIDWSAITDRTRNLRANSHWENPADIIRSAAAGYALDKWDGQDYRPEVWIEKDALVGILEAACEPLDVAYFSCRGYTSISELWSAAQRLIWYSNAGQQPIIFHLGDHDPSGIDMSRDIADRLEMFGADVEFRRIALNMDQVERYDPPPNPAKQTDSRFSGYENQFGDKSWELDALPPDVLANLIRESVRSVQDADQYNAIVRRERGERALLSKAAANWSKLAKTLNGMGGAAPDAD